MKRIRILIGEITIDALDYLHSKKPSRGFEIEDGKYMVLVIHE